MNSPNTDLNPLPGHGEEIERTAAAWVLREAEGLDEVGRAKLNQWLGEDPRHREILDEMRETSGLLDQLREPAVTNREAARAPVARFRPARWLLPLAAAAAVAVLWWSGSVSRGRSGAFVEAATTAVGELRTMSLPDGSVVQLNTASEVRVSYTADERRLELRRGEALFEVARNPARPFVVDVGSVSVRAVGTAFGVRRRESGVDVLVTHGKVAVERTAGGTIGEATGGSTFFLQAGQRTTVGVQAEVAAAAPMAAESVPVADVDRLLAWRSGRLEFSDVTLAEAVAEFNRYNQHQLVLVDPALAARRFGGTFSAQGYAAFVELLEQNFGVAAERSRDSTLLRQRRP